MRALSLKQPWAEMILRGKKTIETRTWNTAFRGEFYIHASKNIDEEACKVFGVEPSELVTGAIVGKAVLVDTRAYPTRESFSKDKNKHLGGFLEFKPRYGFLLERVERIKPIPYKGRLNFFNVDISPV